MRHSPHISTRRPGAGALSALVLLSLLMVSVDRLEASRPGGGVAVAAAAGTRAGLGGVGVRAAAPVRQARTLAAFRADNVCGVGGGALTSEQVSGTKLATLVRCGLLDLPPPAGAIA